MEPDSLNFLTLNTKLQSRSAFCKYPSREVSMVIILAISIEYLRNWGVINSNQSCFFFFTLLSVPLFSFLARPLTRLNIHFPFKRLPRSHDELFVPRTGSEGKSATSKGLIICNWKIYLYFHERVRLRPRGYFFQALESLSFTNTANGRHWIQIENFSKKENEKIKTAQTILMDENCVKLLIYVSK